MKNRIYIILAFVIYIISLIYSLFFNLPVFFLSIILFILSNYVIYKILGKKAYKESVSYILEEIFGKNNKKK